MKQYDITLLTAARYLHPEQPDWYVRQILHEDLLVREALERLGLRVHRIDWSSETFNWSETSSVLFRAVWDYTDRYDEFLRFLHSVSRTTTLINPLETILWNLDKHYLLDLSARGIAVPDTFMIEKSTETTLAEQFSRSGCTEIILKPAMSAGARHTYRITSESVATHEKIFRRLISSESMMIQPFLPSVLTHGEITLVVIGGIFTHAVIKKAREGDFRVQDDFGGSVNTYSPTQEEITFAERAVHACAPLPLYARVDMLRDHENRLVISEIELTEPELWFRFHPPAADRLAGLIAALV